MSRQAVKLGGTIEAATPNEVADIIARAFDEQRAEDYWRLKDGQLLNAAGGGSFNYRVPAQYDWLIERWNIGPVPAGDTGTAYLYQDAPDASAFLGSLQAGPNGTTTGFSPRVVVPANSQLIVVVAGGTAGDPWSWNFQIRRIRSQKRNPA